MVDPGSFSFDQMITNLSYSFGNLQRLIVAISYVAGLAMVLRGIMMYRAFANQTYGSAMRGELAGPLVFLVVGGILIYFPTTLEISQTTLFGAGPTAEASSIITYQNISNAEKWSELSDILVKYIKLIGMIAFVRGWVILSKMGHSGSQPGSIAKGIVHVIAGICLINIVEFLVILATTLGFSV